VKHISEPQHLGHLLSNIRHSLGYTKEQMADTLGVTERTIRNYESGTTRLTIENWVRCVSIVERKVNDAVQVIDHKQIPKQVAKVVEAILKDIN
jgi:predicted transcriptional regulator